VTGERSISTTLTSGSQFELNHFDAKIAQRMQEPIIGRFARQVKAEIEDDAEVTTALE
jgi:hypothetical protein